MIGTRGVPANYGGFETAVEEIGTRLVRSGHKVDVYCRNAGQKVSAYRGMRLINLPAVRRRSLETLSHTGLSVLHAVASRPDAAILFNAANAPFIPILRSAGIPVAVHMDGLEWQRQKWVGAGARYYRRAEARAARSGAPLIADARGIANHLKAEYGVTSHFIPYGAPITDAGQDRLAEFGLTSFGYHLVVARFEPENHVHMIVRGYLESEGTLPLVVVGGAPYSNDYQGEISQLAALGDIRLTGSIWDQGLLTQLYGNCRSYLHGHSVGGTNPSLLRAMGSRAPVSAFDVTFNREVAGENARYFQDSASVAAAILLDEQRPEDARTRGEAGQRHVANHYRWDSVARDYESLLLSMTHGTGSG